MLFLNEKTLAKLEEAFIENRDSSCTRLFLECLFPFRLVILRSRAVEWGLVFADIIVKVRLKDGIG
jgi:hypothetical protein